MKESAEKLGITDDYLLDKLKTGLELSIPDQKKLKKMEERDRIEMIKQINVKAGVSCISELNKMLGKYAPEKIQTSQDDAQFKEMLEKHKKEC